VKIWGESVALMVPESRAAVACEALRIFTWVWFAVVPCSVPWPVIPRSSESSGSQFRTGTSALVNFVPTSAEATVEETGDRDPVSGHLIVDRLISGAEAGVARHEKGLRSDGPRGPCDGGIEKRLSVPAELETGGILSRRAARHGWDLPDSHPKSP
jgi:hypothetical protein